MYYEDYITKKADRFPFDKAQFTFFNSVESDAGYITGTDRDTFDVSEATRERYFEGAMREMVSYLFDRVNEAREEHGTDIDFGPLYDPENIANIYISQQELEAPIVIVEYEEVPEWFTMHNAVLRELYWYPNPANSGEFQAAYFQPRKE